MTMFTIDYMRDVLYALEEQAAGIQALGETVPPWLVLDIAWAKEQIEVMSS